VQLQQCLDTTKGNVPARCNDNNSGLRKAGVSHLGHSGLVAASRGLSRSFSRFDARIIFGDDLLSPALKQAQQSACW
jgi:hypothetical protein